MTSSILITGADGQLGKYVVAKAGDRNLLTPDIDELDIRDKDCLDEYFAKNNIIACIHCAALARMSMCEQDPIEAVQNNVIGTANLVTAILNYEQQHKVNVRIVHVSTDGIYQSTDGNYSETGPTIPYNKYGWTKLGAEACINLLSDYCIIRTRFFDPEKFKFDREAVDSFTSKIPVQQLAENIWDLLDSNFRGTVNIGGDRISDFDLQKKYNSSVKSCVLAEIKAPCPVSKDASMDTSIWENIQKQLSQKN